MIRKVRRRNSRRTLRVLADNLRGVGFYKSLNGGVRVDELMQFAAVMAALSAGAQAVTQQMKKRITFLHLQAKAQPNDSKWDEIYEETLRRVNIHFLAGVNGAVLAGIAQVHPLQMLKLTPIWSNMQPEWAAGGLDYVSAGVLVAYGGPWFHDLLGVLRAYKMQLRVIPPVK